MISLYFLKALPFDFDAFRIGIVQSMQSFCRALSNAVLVVILVLIEVPDTTIMLLALLVSNTCVILLGLSKKNWQVYAGIYYIMHAYITMIYQIYVSFLLVL